MRVDAECISKTVLRCNWCFQVNERCYYYDEPSETTEVNAVMKEKRETDGGKRTRKTVLKSSKD